MSRCAYAGRVRPFAPDRYEALSDRDAFFARFQADGRLAPEREGDRPNTTPPRWT